MNRDRARSTAVPDHRIRLNDAELALLIGCLRELEKTGGRGQGRDIHNLRVRLSGWGRPPRLVAGEPLPPPTP